MLTARVNLSNAQTDGLEESLRVFHSQLHLPLTTPIQTLMQHQLPWMVGQTCFFFFPNNLRPLWASHLFISSILLNSRKVRRPAFPRKWILIYSGQKKKKQQTSDRLFFEKLTNAFCPRRATLRFQEHLLRFVSFNFSGISFLVW